MDRDRRSNLAFGILLLLVGGWFLAVQLVPDLGAWVEAYFDWPFFVIGAGVLLLVVGILTGVPGMAIPASIVSGVGGLLYWQNATGNWASWAYAWTLIPGFAGVGTVIMGLLGENRRRSIQEGIQAIIISLVLFAVFSSFLGGQRLLGAYWPVLIILLGVWLLLRPMFGSRKA
jgi:hypothetical protein